MDEIGVGSWRDVLLIFLGSLISLLSTHVPDAIKNGYRRKEIRRSVCLELEEIRVRLAIMAVHVAMRDATITHELLVWAKAITKDYRGFFSSQVDRKGLDEALAWDAQTLKDTFEAKRDQRMKRGLNFKKLSTPFLTANSTSLHLFSVDFERSVREFAARLPMINEDIEEADFFFKKGFDASLVSEQHALARANREEIYKNIGKRSKDLADMAGEVIAKAN